MMPQSSHAGGWRTSRHPPGCKFAFTIVHDADSAYSQRLRPLFDVFDDLGFRLTVTAFTYWAEWAHDGAIWAKWRDERDQDRAFLAPKSVPLADPVERQFYRQLAARGHEIGMHSASETSDTRARIQAAMASFEETFGAPPAVYVEHSPENNKDALANEGADPASPYYCLDLLRESGAWLWIGYSGLRPHGDERYYQIAPDQPLLDLTATRRFGLTKAFVRTGRRREARGDDFLKWYSEDHIDALEGSALVYMHLDMGWLDLQTRQMRRPLAERLRYLASKPGWFAPASQILDRTRAVDGICLTTDGRRLLVENTTEHGVTELVLIAPARKSLRCGNEELRPNSSSRIVVPSVGAHERLTFDIVDA